MTERSIRRLIGRSVSVCYCARVDLDNIPVISVHETGCKYGREFYGGHSEAARRLSDSYNLHKTAGRRRGWIAVRFEDGRTDDEVYPTRSQAVAYQHHNEREYAFIELVAPSMTVCEAASVLRFQAHAYKLAHPDVSDGDDALIVIPRLTIADRERQIDAMTGRNSLPLALGKKR